MIPKTMDLPELAKTDAARNALDLRMIPIADIAADPGQPRKTFGAAALDELGASLAIGQTNPIRVRPRWVDENFPPEIKWVLVHGERRLHAARRREISRLRAEIAWSVGAAADAAEVLLGQIADNLQRVDLGAVEEAAGIRRYAELSGLGTREVAVRIGKNQMYVSLAIGMGDMPAAIVKRIEEDAQTEDGYSLSWRHLRQLLRLKDEPEVLENVYDDAVVNDRSTARELETIVTQELDWLEGRRKQEAAEAKLTVNRLRKEEKATGQTQAQEAAAFKAGLDAPMSHLDAKAKHEALAKARMTRVRKDLIRGNLPEIVAQVNRIARTIRLPKELAGVVACRIGGWDVWSLTKKVPGNAHTSYGEDFASLVVPELLGKWSNVRLGSAMNGGRWADDDEAGRQWLAFVYWLATETRGVDAELDRESRDVLKARDTKIDKATKRTKPTSSRGKTLTPTVLVCARDDCVTTFHVKHGPGRRPKYCAEHRSK